MRGQPNAGNFNFCSGSKGEELREDTLEVEILFKRPDRVLEHNVSIRTSTSPGIAFDGQSGAREGSMDVLSPNNSKLEASRTISSRVLGGSSMWGIRG